MPVSEQFGRDEIDTALRSAFAPRADSTDHFIDATDPRDISAFASIFWAILDGQTYEPCRHCGGLGFHPVTEEASQ